NRRPAWETHPVQWIFHRRGCGPRPFAAADIKFAVRPHRPAVYRAREPFCKRPHRSLPFALYLFQCDAHDDAVLKIADEHLPLERPKPIVRDDGDAAGRGRQSAWEPDGRRLKIFRVRVIGFRRGVTGWKAVKLPSL